MPYTGRCGVKLGSAPGPAKWHVNTYWCDRPPAHLGVLSGPGTPKDPKSHHFATKWVAIPPFGTWKLGSDAEFRQHLCETGQEGVEDATTLRGVRRKISQAIEQDFEGDHD